LWWLIFRGTCERGEDPVNTGGLQEFSAFFDGFLVVNLWFFDGGMWCFDGRFSGAENFPLF
jgi:hypothetical protein